MQMFSGNLVVNGTLYDSSFTPYVKQSDPIGFWLAPGSFDGPVTRGGYGNNYVPQFSATALQNLDTFISIPITGKRLELTTLFTSNTTGTIVAGIELRYLQILQDSRQVLRCLTQ
jgi:hypothetical protein